MTEYITSDWHFGHENICGPEGFVPLRRQFSSSDEMDTVIIRHFNSLVKEKDHTYMLGDISMRRPEWVFDVLEKLNGSFTFIRGNHDNSKLVKYLHRHNHQLADGRWKYQVHDVGIRLKANRKVYYLTHFPLGIGEYRKTYRNLCGHIHELSAREANMLNVGIDSPEIGSRPFGEPLELRLAMKMVDEKWQNFSDKTKRDLLV